MNLEKFTIKAQEALAGAQQKAIAENHSQLEPDHVLAVLVADGQGVVPMLLKKLGTSAESLNTAVDAALRKLPRVQGTPGQVYASPNFNLLLNGAMNEAQTLKDEYVSTEHLFLAMTDLKGSQVQRILNEAGISRDRILKALQEVRGNQRVTDQNPEGKYMAACQGR